MGRLGSLGSLDCSSAGELSLEEEEDLLPFLSFFPPRAGGSSTSSLLPPRLDFLSFLPGRIGVVEKGRTVDGV